jgi:opacity protein-like surface antigen
MKKILLILTAVTAMYMTAIAQVRKANKEKTGFLIFTAGPAFPVGDFNSKNINNDQAGFAKTGFTLDLQGGYMLVKNFGVAGSILYSRYTIDSKPLNGTSASVDHWQYYGMVAGPMITQSLCSRTSVDFNIMSGIVSANSPKLTYAGEVLVSEDWAIAIPIRLSGDIRYHFGQNGYFFTGLNYLYMEPKFKFSALGESNTARQKMSTMNLNAGIGFRF